MIVADFGCLPGNINHDPRSGAANRGTGEDECFAVLDGELSVRCGGEIFDAPRGSFVFLPRGRPHRFWARDRPARLLLIAVPGGIEDYFRELNKAADDQERHRIGELHGIRVVPG
jgi:mannose-6-phosphate isomerase-like protein (cupin superfamily)